MSSQRVDRRIPHNNLQVVFPGSQESANVNRIRRMPDETRAIPVDIDLSGLADGSFEICLHAEFRQWIRFLYRLTESKIEYANSSRPQVLGRKIESLRVAHPTRIVSERRILAPGMKLGHGNCLICLTESELPVAAEVDGFRNAIRHDSFLFLRLIC